MHHSPHGTPSFISQKPHKLSTIHVTDHLLLSQNSHQLTLLNSHRSSYRSPSLTLTPYDSLYKTLHHLPHKPPSLIPLSTHHTLETLSLTPQSSFLTPLTPYHSPHRPPLLIPQIPSLIPHIHLPHRPHQRPLGIPINDL